MIRFELSIWGFLAVGVVFFCIFLWMFLLGIWAGQTVLQFTADGRSLSAFSGIAAWVGDKGDIFSGKDAALGGRGGEKTPPADNTPEEWGPDEPSTVEPSFFSIQVASFRDRVRAEKLVLSWTERAEKSFVLPLETNAGTFYRVYVGQFETVAEANDRAAHLGRENNVQTYVHLVPKASLPDS